MTTAFLLLVILSSVAGTMYMIWRDARGPRPAPLSHRTDADFLPPASVLSTR
ncbi:hypothetical protein [Nocardioides stalactiti]|uniref:hypothetical protein n=1 Tax=Nocardioides stalactiti TaxID=2755356 RepID=UPI0015FFAAC9|nr:hypothetical protein [Nocardioides stalactiti]